MGYSKAEQIIRESIRKLRSKASQKQREVDKLNKDVDQLESELNNH